MEKRETIFRGDFLVLNVMMFLTFCNVAVFFDYYHYLESLPIPPQSYGILIAVFSLAVLVLRPPLSLIIRPANAKKWIAISCLLLIGTLVLYDVAKSFWTMFLIRIIHGATYVAMATAVLARLVTCIPREKSGQAFGLFSVVTLLPYALIPPIIEPLKGLVGGFDRVLDLSGLLLLPVFPLLALLDEDRMLPQKQGLLGVTPSEIMGNLKNYKVAFLLILSLLVWTAFTPVFFFLQGFAKEHGVLNPGLFFTLSTFTEMAVRLVAGRLFDKLNKPRLLALSSAWLVICYILLVNFGSLPRPFFLLGLLFGVGWGFAMPLLNGLLFDVSEDRFKSLNTNLAMEMFQAGFFVGPLAGGIILVHSGYSALYYSCAALMLLGVALAFCLFERPGLSPIRTA